MGDCAIWLLVSILTLITSPASIFSQQLSGKSFSDTERVQVCFKRFDIHLGDSFQQVNSLIYLNRDPNGKNQNITWQKGRFTDFYSVGEAQLEIDKENWLNPHISCTFDDQKQLKSFHISWTHEGVQNVFLKRKIIDVLIDREHPCMTGKKIKLEKSRYAEKTNYGGYVEKFEYGFSKRSFWRVSYSIEMKR